jgi:hypothetical protein
MMGYELEIVLRKIEGPFVCILDEKKKIFESVEAFMSSDFEKRCEILSICVTDGKIELELKKLPLANDLNASWVQEHIKKFGHEPGFFD